MLGCESLREIRKLGNEIPGFHYCIGQLNPTEGPSLGLAHTGVNIRYVINALRTFTGGRT